MGYKLLRRTRIQVDIKQERHRISRDLHVSVDRVVQELARVGFADIRRLFDENGRMKPIADLDPETAAAISGIEFTRERTTTSNVTAKPEAEASPPAISPAVVVGISSPGTVASGSCRMSSATRLKRTMAPVASR